ncbi:MAG: 30S ribosomal protein S17 [candidate division Zixibacteria bacterium HGW-Zixibacteria-1]|nr:ribosomal protein S17 [uncultured bacterium]PKK84598.1 MAG: 30S ribosomal protein S17 [candidate division Zixibacteria bacterium HGW-Zixibacteria-1]
MKRNMRKVRQGKVVSSSMDKTIIVNIERAMKHPVYERIIRTSSKLYAHDEANEANVGDVVRVMETRPLSLKKCWRLVEIVERAK